MDSNIQSKVDKENNVIKYRVFMIAFAIIIAVGIFLGYNSTLSTKAYSNFAAGIKSNTINDYISYNINGEDDKKVLMSDIKFIPLKKGDVMNITIDLNNNYSEENVISLMAEFCTVDAYVDDNIVYSYGHSLYQTNQCLGGGYFKIPIKEDYLGEKLEIKLKASEPNFVSGIENISVENNDSLINSFVAKNIFVIVIGIAILVFGIIIFVLSFYKVVINSEARLICWISISYILLAMWTLCHFKIFQIYSNNLQFITSVEYLCLYASLIPFTMFFKEYAEKRYVKIIFNVVLSIMIIFLLTTIVLCNMEVTHYIEVLPVFHGIVVIGAVLLIIFLIKNCNNVTQKLDISFVFSMVFATVMIALEIVRFYAYAIFKLYIFSFTLIPIAIVIFMISIIYKYIIGMLKKSYKNSIQSSLVDLAFKDQLTQVPNRTKCEEYMRALSGKLNEGYTVINLDLNNLKYVNDTFGHHIGDEMIFAGAQIIKDTFSKYGQIGRMGGDEFIAIITIIDKDEIEKLITKMNNKVIEFNKKNEKQKDYILSIAYGYSIKSKESTESIWKVYEKADKLMYSFKKQQKEKLNINYER